MSTNHHNYFTIACSHYSLIQEKSTVQVKRSWPIQKKRRQGFSIVLLGGLVRRGELAWGGVGQSGGSGRLGGGSMSSGKGNTEGHQRL